MAIILSGLETKNSVLILNLIHYIKPLSKQKMRHGLEKVVIWWCNVWTRQFQGALPVPQVCTWSHGYCARGHYHAPEVCMFNWPMSSSNFQSIIYFKQLLSMKVGIHRNIIWDNHKIPLKTQSMSVSNYYCLTAGSETKSVNQISISR